MKRNWYSSYFNHERGKWEVVYAYGADPAEALSEGFYRSDVQIGSTGPDHQVLTEGLDNTDFHSVGQLVERMNEHEAAQISWIPTTNTNHTGEMK